MSAENITLNNFARALTLQVEGKSINGFVSTQNVANFLNIPYAKFPARFRTAQTLAVKDLPASVDAMQYGPRCPQKVDSLHIVMKDVFEQLSSTQRTSEHDCLHLNIYTPPDSLKGNSNELLPVFAWIHGGAFNNGDNTTELDGNHLVQRSIELGKPIIIVTINYRVNVLGFSASRELIEEAKSLGETPVLAQGLNDQTLALEWLQSSIQHFGGDAKRITLGGESAGAASVFYHLHGGRPLFQQALIQSSPLPQLRTLEEGQAAFDKLIAAAGISADGSWEAKLAALRVLSADKLLEFFDGDISAPIADPNWFALLPNAYQGSPEFWGKLPDWCHRVVLGHTKDEASLFFAMLADWEEPQVVAFVKSTVSDAQAAEFLTGGKPALETIISCVTEDLFVHPALELASVASTQGGKLYMYSVDVTDPFPGPLHGYAWHSFGVPLTFYQPPGRVYAALKATQERMSVAHINFFYGLEPWQEHGDTKLRQSWDGEASKTLPTSITKNTADAKARLAVSLSVLRRIFTM